MRLKRTLAGVGATALLATGIPLAAAPAANAAPGDVRFITSFPQGSTAQPGQGKAMKILASSRITGKTTFIISTSGPLQIAGYNRNCSIVRGLGPNHYSCTIDVQRNRTAKIEGLSIKVTGASKYQEITSHKVRVSSGFGGKSVSFNVRNPSWKQERLATIKQEYASMAARLRNTNTTYRNDAKAANFASCAAGGGAGLLLVALAPKQSKKALIEGSIQQCLKSAGMNLSEVWDLWRVLFGSPSLNQW